MSGSEIKSIRLLLMEIRLEHDVVLCRQRARQFSAALGMSPRAQISIATALSEIARNAFQYAGGGRVEFSFETEPRNGLAKPRQALVITVRDTGPGIAQLEEILGGRYRSPSGLGRGILGAKRLMDRVEISTLPEGTTVVLRQVIPPGNPPIEPAKVQSLIDALLQQAPSSVIEDMQLQNQ